MIRSLTAGLIEGVVLVRCMDTKSKNVHLMGDRSGFVDTELRTILAAGFYFEGLFYGDANAGQVSQV